MRDYLNQDLPIRFLFPIDGDCINENDGNEAEDGVRILARVEAPKGHLVRINGAYADFEEKDGCYAAWINIRGKETVLTARDMSDGTWCRISVFRLPRPTEGYRLSSDDNIIFLWDINEHKDTYHSIFENPYLSVYKKAHDLYGAKVHLNLFYEFDDEARKAFSTPRPYFNLSMMTDRFREEFRANADWLKLSFHAKREMPPAPYKYADGETVRRDCEQVHREIIRFAGEECLSECTTVHFGEANEEGVRALRDLGYRAFTGYFKPAGWPVAYYAPQELIEYVYHRDFWRDTENDVLFGRIDLVLNCNTPEENMKELRATAKSPTRGGFVSIMIHEQYFYEDYVNYLPDFAQRVLEPCDYLSWNGYVGRHIMEAGFED